MNRAARCGTEKLSKAPGPQCRPSFLTARAAAHLSRTIRARKSKPIQIGMVRYKSRRVRGREHHRVPRLRIKPH